MKTKKTATTTIDTTTVATPAVKAVDGAALKAQLDQYLKIEADLAASNAAAEAQMNDIAKELYEALDGSGTKQLAFEQGGPAFGLSHRGDKFFVKSPRKTNVRVVG